MFCIFCNCKYREHEKHKHKHAKKKKLKGVKIVQIGEHHKMATITGLDPVSGQGTFELNPVPVGASLPSGVVPSWTSSDVTIASVESPNSDATGITIKVSRASDAGGSITLTGTITLADGTIMQDAVVVPVPAVVPPPPPKLTGVSISQIG